MTRERVLRAVSEELAESDRALSIDDVAALGDVDVHALERCSRPGVG